MYVPHASLSPVLSGKRGDPPNPETRYFKAMSVDEQRCLLESTSSLPLGAGAPRARAARDAQYRQYARNIGGRAAAATVAGTAADTARGRRTMSPPGSRTRVQTPALPDSTPLYRATLPAEAPAAALRRRSLSPQSLRNPTETSHLVPAGSFSVHHLAMLYPSQDGASRGLDQRTAWPAEHPRTPHGLAWRWQGVPP